MPEHSSFAVWALYLLGQCVHILKRAGMAVRSKSNSIRSRSAFVAHCWDALLVRLVLCAGLFWWLLADPRSLARVLALCGVHLAPDFSMGLGTALIFGYFADSVLDWLVSRIPILQKELPAVNGSSHPAP